MQSSITATSVTSNLALSPSAEESNYANPHNDGNVAFRISKFARQLFPLANFIGANRQEILTASRFLCQPNIPATFDAVPGIPSVKLLSTNNRNTTRKVLIPLLNFFPKPKEGEEAVNEGSFKKVEPALEITFSPTGWAFYTAQKVLFSIKNKLHKNDVSNVDRGIKKINEIISTANEESFFISPYESLDFDDQNSKTSQKQEHLNSSSEDTPQNFTYAQKWALSNLESALQSDFVSTHFDSTKSLKKFHSLDCLKCLLDTAQNLAFFHKQELAHRDVKTKNILVFYNKKNKNFDGAITDFDYLNDFGWDPSGIHDTYFYWDPLAVCNVNASTVDTYGMLLSFFEVWSFYKKRNPIDFSSIRNSIMLEMATGKTPNLGSTSINAYFESRVKLICYQSMIILLSILKKRKIDVAKEFETQRKRFPNDNKQELCVSFLQYLTRKNYDLFTKEAVIEATKEAEELMRKEKLQIFTMNALIHTIKKMIDDAKTPSLKQ